MGKLKYRFQCDCCRRNVFSSRYFGTSQDSVFKDIRVSMPVWLSSTGLSWSSAFNVVTVDIANISSANPNSSLWENSEFISMFNLFKFVSFKGITMQARRVGSSLRNSPSTFTGIPYIYVAYAPLQAASYTGSYLPYKSTSCPQDDSALSFNMLSTESEGLKKVLDFPPCFSAGNYYDISTSPPFFNVEPSQVMIGTMCYLPAFHFLDIPTSIPFTSMSYPKIPLYFNLGWDTSVFTSGTPSQQPISEINFSLHCEFICPYVINLS